MGHPNIVEFYRAFAFEDYTYVVLELCPNGSLMDMVKSRGCLSLPEVRRYMIQLCGGVKYMHQRCVIHRDLKMGNIFLDSHMDVKIGDFGLAAVVLDDKDRRQTLCGTPNYIAPEILNKSSGNGHDSKVDTWAVGIICYAMLIGSPPFASKTQAEIYAKLKQLQYDWKETDSQNFIPIQAKQLVSSCLNLNGAERPGMDDLVEHDFFKMGAIAEEMETTCRTTKPGWLESADPRGDRVRTGYGMDYSKICQTSGVGKLPSGKVRPAVGENLNKSAMTEVELENAQGCAPVIPLPEGVIYRQFTAAKKEWASVRKFPVRTALSKSKDVSAQTGATFTRTESSKPASDNTAQFQQNNAVTSSANIPPPSRPVQSFAAQQRQQALPTRIVSRQPDSPEELQPPILLKVDEEPAPKARGYLRERPLRATSTRSMRSNSAREAPMDTQRAIPKSSTISGGTSRTLARPVLDVTDDVVPDRPVTMGRSASHRVFPVRASSRNSNSTENNLKGSTLVLLSSNTLPRVLRPTSANDRLPIDNKSDEDVRPVPNKPLSNHFVRPRLLSASGSSTRLKDTSPSAMLASLRRLQENLSPSASLLSAQDSSSSHRAPPHPVVEKWVDYTNRYGMAYILSDSTVGVVLKSEDSKASSCVVVRNARKFYTRRSRKLESQLVPQDAHAAPIEFYEQCGEEGMKKVEVAAERFRLDVEQFGADMSAATSELAESLNKESGGSAEAARLRLVVLVDKFGKYMTKTLGSEEDEEMQESNDAKKGNSGKFINFYQRLGNVGMWGFAGGAFQLNFPDHTKMVLYTRAGPVEGQEECLLDLYYLQTADAIYLKKTGTFKANSLERRNLVTLRVRDVLDDVIGVKRNLRAYKDVVESNEVKEKLAWVRGVVGCWVKEGGVGRMGSEKIGWTGLQGDEKEKEKKSKLVWVSVGRAGGDCGDGEKV